MGGEYNELRIDKMAAPKLLHKSLHVRDTTLIFQTGSSPRRIITTKMAVLHV